jgi:2,3-bisphosphoglycerate-dependent phosphoglycerate mutase
VELPYYAAGFFFDTAGRVLLNLRAATAPVSPGVWSCFGGVAEPGDGDDPVATWRRETREELGLDFAAERARLVYRWVGRRDGQVGYFYCAPSRPFPDFVGPEGERFAWFALDEALALPGVPGAHRRALELFRAGLEAAGEGGAPRLDALYLVRHCRATGQEPEAPLTEDGRAEAEALADVLAELWPDRIVASPFRRARESVAPLAARLRLPLEVDARLAERVLSAAPRDDWLDVLRATFEDPDLAPLGGESSRAAAARGMAALADARRGGQRVVVVTHGNLLALLLREHDRRFGFEEWRRLGNPDVFRVGERVERLGR